MQKSITILKIILLIILISILLGVVVIFIKKDFNFDFNSKTTLIYDKNIEEDFNTIDINSKSLDYNFVKADDKNVNVKVYDEEDSEIDIYVENNTLKIISDKEDYCFLCFLGGRKVVISLPEKEYDLVVNTASSDIKSSVNFKEVTVVSKSGDFKFNKVENSNMKITSGNLDIKEADNISIISKSGDIIIGKINDSLNIESTSGDIFINNLTITKDSYIKITSGDILINKSSDNIYYDTKVTSGDVIIAKNNRHADYELKINTKSGDVLVK